MLVRALTMLTLFAAASSLFADDGTLKLNLRSRTEIGENTGRYQATVTAGTSDMVDEGEDSKVNR